ncbi:hypothetical protein ACJMK2_028030 [Sinanodonta woodiana]|uniref:Uncharacterized protein n=1 Tax=Sinanodonta woodiana TaxID=1069815 RepID=A0ABD3X5T9_SINWO
MEEFERLSKIKIKPSKSRFDLDRITPDFPREEKFDPTNNLIECIQGANTKFRDDGASQTWSTLNIIRNTKYVDEVVDAKINDEREVTIINYLDKVIFSK